jgi:hypothetical protein
MMIHTVLLQMSDIVSLCDRSAPGARESGLRLVAPRKRTSQPTPRPIAETAPPVVVRMAVSVEGSERSPDV